nr:hypothetical protein [Tanacetum cinerariifolium]
MPKDRPTICYNDDDDEDCIIAITPILSTNDPDNSLSMGDEHLDTVLATESDEVIKSSVENLVSIPSESDEISSGSSTTHADISLPDYEAFYDDHVKEISSGRVIFMADELAHIIYPPEYDCFSFKNESNSGDFTMDVVEDTFPTREPRVHVHNVLPTHLTLQLNLDFILSSESLFTYVKLEILKKEKEGVDGKLAGFLTASKYLDNLIESQRADKNKDGLGYKSSPDDAQNQKPSVTATEASPSTISPKPLIKFVKAVDRSTERATTNKVKTAKKPSVKYAKQYKKPAKKSTVRGNQRNWNNLKSQQLESSPDDAQNQKPSVNATEASPSTISPKLLIKFVKAVDRSTERPTTNKVKTAKKPSVKYAKQYKKPAKKSTV